MTLTKLEQETIILYNEKEKTASVYTHNAKLIAKLKRLSEKYPDLIYPERPEHPGAVEKQPCFAAAAQAASETANESITRVCARYIVPKSCICVREPYSAARRQADSARAKAEGRSPPRKTRSEQGAENG